VSGFWIDGELNGTGEIKSWAGVLGNVTYKGPVSMGRPSGKGEGFYEDGSVYKGEWQPFGRHGRGLLTYPTDGRKFKVVYENNELINKNDLIGYKDGLKIVKEEMKEYMESGKNW